MAIFYVANCKRLPEVILLEDDHFRMSASIIILPFQEGEKMLEMQWAASRSVPDDNHDKTMTNTYEYIWDLFLVDSNLSLQRS